MSCGERDVCEVKQVDNGWIIEWDETFVVEKDAKRYNHKGNVIGTYERTDTIYHKEVYTDVNAVKERVKKLAMQKQEAK